MSLAHQLADLATANSEGLLSDDEYRLLRLNLFETHANTNVTPVELSLVPETKSHPPTASSRTSIPGLSNDPIVLSPPPTRSRNSVAISVTTLLRRATGRKTPPAPRSDSNDTPKPTPLQINVPTTPTTSKRNGALHLPRLLHRKISDLRLRDDSTSSHSSRSSISHFIPPPSPSGRIPTTPLYTSQSSSSLRLPQSPTKSSAQLGATGPDPFAEDDTLQSSQSIRAAIQATEIECERILTAFAHLEATTSHRIQQQTARRLPAATPASAAVLIEGREWRDHSPLPPPPLTPTTPTTAITPTSSSIALAPPSRSHDSRLQSQGLQGTASLQPHRRHRLTDSYSDALSTRSRSSSTGTEPSLSTSKSISSLRKPPASPLTNRTMSSQQQSPPPTVTKFPRGLRRTGSVSSVSSRGTEKGKDSASNSSSSNRGSGGRLAPSVSGITVSRSVGHLPILFGEEEEEGAVDRVGGGGGNGVRRGEGRLLQRKGSSLVGHGKVREEREGESELLDIQRRRAEVAARYEARLDYLRARLKGAELKEKVMRR